MLKHYVVYYCIIYWTSKRYVSEFAVAEIANYEIKETSLYVKRN